ncbi:hypothetical protein K502DRAFT_339347 [Neoconidiobolus thromboides FSU 785]|nr:hypothetical protein K502DRAFT_339347 [Neoconidiobolus thromboides FSU 785]
MVLTYNKAQLLLQQNTSLLKEYERCILLNIEDDSYHLEINSNHQQLLNFYKSIETKIDDEEDEELQKKYNKFEFNFKTYVERYNLLKLNEDVVEMNLFSSNNPTANSNLNNNDDNLDVDDASNLYQNYNNQDLLLMQQQTIQDQDRNLDLLSSSISNQKHISLQINEELINHNELLTELEDDLDNTDNNLTQGRKRLKVLEEKLSNWRLWLIIVGCFIGLLLVIKYV